MAMFQLFSLFCQNVNIDRHAVKKRFFRLNKKNLYRILFAEIRKLIEIGPKNRFDNYDILQKSCHTKVYQTKNSKLSQTKTFNS